MITIPLEIVYFIFKYLDLDVQWSLRKQPQWNKKWFFEQEKIH